MSAVPPEFAPRSAHSDPVTAGTGAFCFRSNARLGGAFSPFRQGLTPKRPLSSPGNRGYYSLSQPLEILWLLYHLLFKMSRCFPKAVKPPRLRAISETRRFLYPLFQKMGFFCGLTFSFVETTFIFLNHFFSAIMTRTCLPAVYPKLSTQPVSL